MTPEKKVQNKIILYLKELQKENNFIISVDGGINDKTINKVKELTNRVISGSYICLSDEKKKKIESLR